MVKIVRLLIGVNILTLIGLSGVSEVEGGFPLIFPFLTSGWYYKPSPTESVFLGLILVKVLAIRLASATGILPIPYHLNDLFLRSFGKRSIDSHKFNNFRQDKNTTDTEIPISIQEFKTIERVLLSLRRIDSKDCFIRLVCEMNQDTLSGREDHSQFLSVFRLRHLRHAHKIPMKAQKSWSVWSVYENATTPEVTDCLTKYPNCPFSKQELEFDALLTGTF